ncbi:unnamed protein product [Symbiodinium necroappetens]|uniref:Uncharacterized protein n=1 Tax=Symbiodinium necroappetens TaxID=1628268 RepID=A0A813C0D1_9DINO|nr:unnamed protein product [Symbiodinium necroappetens]
MTRAAGNAGISTCLQAVFLPPSAHRESAEQVLQLCRRADQNVTGDPQTGEVWLKPLFAHGYQLAVRAATTEFTGQLFEEANSVRVIVTRVATELPSRQRLRKSAHVRSVTRCAPQRLPGIVNTLLGLCLRGELCMVQLTRFQIGACCKLLLLPFRKLRTAKPFGQKTELCIPSRPSFPCESRDFTAAAEAAEARQARQARQARGPCLHPRASQARCEDRLRLFRPRRCGANVSVSALKSAACDPFDRVCVSGAFKALKPPIFQAPCVVPGAPTH